jgi:mono/diheme cytochrome c family protein
MVTGLRRAARLVGTALGLSALISMAGLAAAQAPWTAPAGEKEKKNPLPADAQTIEQGRKVAQINCVTCHGAKGKGDGAAAVALNPRPADWTSKAVQDDTDGELFWKITTGRGAMPAWRHLPEKDRWALVRYVRTLAAK